MEQMNERAQFIHNAHHLEYHRNLHLPSPSSSHAQTDNPRKQQNAHKPLQACPMFLCLLLNEHPLNMVHLRAGLPMKAMFFLYMHDVSWVNFIKFQVSNQLWWTAMVLHLSMLQNIEVKRKTKSISSWQLFLWATCKENQEIIFEAFFLALVLIFNGATLWIAVTELVGEW
jgi:hypothetical protein